MYKELEKCVHMFFLQSFPQVRQKVFHPIVTFGHSFGRDALNRGFSSLNEEYGFVFLFKTKWYEAKDYNDVRDLWIDLYRHWERRRASGEGPFRDFEHHGQVPEGGR